MPVRRDGNVYVSAESNMSSRLQSMPSPNRRRTVQQNLRAQSVSAGIGHFLKSFAKSRETRSYSRSASIRVTTTVFGLRSHFSRNVPISTARSEEHTSEL